MQVKTKTSWKSSSFWLKALHCSALINHFHIYWYAGVDLSPSKASAVSSCTLPDIRQDLSLVMHLDPGYHAHADNGLSNVTPLSQINALYEHAVPCNLGQLLFLSQLIWPFTPMLYDSHISLLTTVSVWRQGLQDVFKSLLLMSCWGWPSVFASPTQAVPGTGSWLLPSLGFCWG